MRSSYRKGQYIACKYQGTGNGDLIVGRIDSVRTNGHIVGVNLLTGKAFAKAASTVGDRNVVISKSQADEIVAAYDGPEATEHFHLADRKAAREKAIQITRALREPKVPRGYKPRPPRADEAD